MNHEQYLNSLHELFIEAVGGSGLRVFQIAGCGAEDGFTVGFALVKSG
jgi:hypothetical protein